MLTDARENKLMVDSGAWDEQETRFYERAMERRKTPHVRISED